MTAILDDVQKKIMFAFQISRQDFHRIPTTVILKFYTPAF